MSFRKIVWAWRQNNPPAADSSHPRCRGSCITEGSSGTGTDYIRTAQDLGRTMGARALPSPAKAAYSQWCGVWCCCEGSGWARSVVAHVWPDWPEDPIASSTAEQLFWYWVTAVETAPRPCNHETDSMTLFGWGPGLSVIVRCSPSGHQNRLRWKLVCGTHFSSPVKMGLRHTLIGLNNCS